MYAPIQIVSDNLAYVRPLNSFEFNDIAGVHTRKIHMVVSFTQVNYCFSKNVLFYFCFCFNSSFFSFPDYSLFENFLVEFNSKIIERVLIMHVNLFQLQIWFEIFQSSSWNSYTTCRCNYLCDEYNDYQEKQLDIFIIFTCLTSISYSSKNNIIPVSSYSMINRVCLFY